LLQVFARANRNCRHAEKAAGLYERQANLFGKMERFLDQAAGWCKIGECYVRLKDADGAAAWFQKARQLSEQHGFYQTECVIPPPNPKPLSP